MSRPLWFTSLVLGWLSMTGNAQASTELASLQKGSDQLAVQGHRLSDQITTIEEAIHLYRRLPFRAWPRLRRQALTRVGDRHKEIVEIRRRLSVLGDHSLLPSHSAEDPHYDRPLEYAVKRFQHRHGLKVDGIIGPNTRRALNVPPDYRLSQLIVNQLRQQAFYQSNPGRYLQVNIPAYNLRYFRHGRLVIEMKAIVGRPKRQTPMLESALETVVFNPDWNVPKGIAYKDIVPELRKDEKTLARKGLQLVQGFGPKPRKLSLDELDWQRLYLGPGPDQQRFWQAPGGENPLGSLKFTFRNRYTVYMHGTPQMELFDEPIRAFSSGCIRIEQPRRLVDMFLAAESQWPETRVDQLLSSTKTRHFRLPQPVPLFLTYWTAWVEHGVVHFRHDIYRRDRQAVSELPPLLPGQEVCRVSQRCRVDTDRRTDPAPG